MSLDHNSQKRSKGLLRILVPLIGSDLIEILAFVLRLAKHTVKFNGHEGMYDVLDYQAQLELVDTEGKQAIFHKRQKVRFLQDNIIAFQDKAWGDGDFMAAYQCSPGVKVDTYPEGKSYRILISLRETKHAGEIEEFRINRTIVDGFVGSIQDFQTNIDHRTRQLSMSVLFPRERQPTKVTMKERNSTRSKELGPEYRTELPDGRVEYSWSTEKPRLFEAYMLRWEW